ncbi:MAG: transposase, partial [Phycisphaerae bacterium]
MSTITQHQRAERKRKLTKRKRRVLGRLQHRPGDVRDDPMLTASNIHYELADRAQGLGAGGIGAIHLLSRCYGLIEAIDRRLHLLKIHQPYHESDHVLNIAYNVLCGGTCLEDLELRRHDEAYLDGLGAERVPDPTTAGDFCRRFEAPDIQALMNAINEVRLKVWRRQPASFFDEAILDADGALIPTTGECKQGMDISYKGDWGYHVLLVSLANTGEPLLVANRSGNRPSHEGASGYLDRAARLCKQAG